MRLYFVRHGQTDENLKNAYYGRLDVPLNAAGEAQARSVARLLRFLEPDEIWMSDLRRVIQTVDIVCPKIYPRKAFKDFREMDFGQWEGLTYDEIRQTYPKDLARWSDDWRMAAPTGGECFDHFFQRVDQTFSGLIRDKGDGKGTVLVAAHNGTLRIMFALMLGLDAGGTWHFNFEQDAYSVVDYEYDNFTIRKINSREPVNV